MMPLQRACGAENQVRNKLSNGPLRAQSKVLFVLAQILHPVFCDVLAYVSCRGYAGILLSVQRHCCKSRWHRGLCLLFVYVLYSSLTDSDILSRTFFCVKFL